MLNHDIKNGTLTLKMSGEIDHSNAPKFRIGTDSLINHGGFNRFIFDLSGITFMDSTAVGFLIGRYKILKKLGIPVYFHNPSREADKVLKVSGLYTIITKI
ncbi:MAG: STAS domain-containing protein [Clostridia bacterium]|nr:STAS domain-containing protein [Clostridia bacterium]